MTAAPAVPVAVIGMALRLPGAITPEELWDNVASGRCSLRRFGPDENADVPDELTSHPDYVPVYGAVPGAEEFDAGLFGYSPREAELTDPQQRKFLECAYEALDSAGYGVQPDGIRVGVVAGTGSNTYQVHNVLPHVALTRDAGDTAMLIASEKDHVATRTAHRLDLRGPALTVQTSCSTSLVAVHMAVRMLQTGEADVMLAGGSTVQSPQQAGHVYTPNGVGSPDGSCRAFDERAAGTVFGSGVGVVVLKRLDEALADNDPIRAVIRGSAINNDGSRKVGYTAPSVTGQVEVIRAAHAAAKVDASTIGYVETHGTGTEVGDVIEVEALREAFGPASGEATCVLGTLKPNIGHTDIAAGVAGLIKAVLVVEKGWIPPSINVTRPSPELGLDGSPFELRTSGGAWRAGQMPRRAGVSSFGLGGTNAHVVIEQAPSRPVREEAPRGPVVLPVSARTEEAHVVLARRLGEHLERDAAERLGDVAHTLQQGRRLHPWRAAVVGSTPETLGRRLRHVQPRQARRSASITYAFSGFGGQWAGMTAGLADRFPVFAAAVEECAGIVQAATGQDVRSLLEGAVPQGPGPDDRLAGLTVGQPAMFMAQYAVARLLGSWGLAPSAVFGHSLGEYAAACVAGALSVEDALHLVLARAAAFDEVPAGAMTAVLAERSEVDELLGGGLSLAAANASNSFVVSGPVPAIEAFERRATEHEIKNRRLPIGVAGHSSMLDGVLPGFRAVAASISHRPLRIPMVSTLTGEVIDAGTVLDADYWTAHLRETVRFAEASERVLRTRNPLVIEIGAGQALTHLVQQIAGSRQHVALSTLPSRQEVLAEGIDPVVGVLQTLGDAWSAGATVDWAAVQGTEVGYRVALPAYPFARERHWLDAPHRTPRQVDVVPQEAPAPAGEVPQPSSSPSARVEAAVKRIWFELLGKEVEDTDASFFAMGGDSLRLVRLIGKVREEFGVSVPLRETAASPTVQFIVGYVERARQEGPSDAE